jgi:hypothetical protein
VFSHDFNLLHHEMVIPMISVCPEQYQFFAAMSLPHVFRSAGVSPGAFFANEPQTAGETPALQKSMPVSD